MKMVCQPRTKNQRRNQVQMKLDVSSLAHTKWECKYHIVFAPKYSVSQIMGYLKGKSSLMIYEKYANLKYKYGNRHFWCRGYYVSTVGRNRRAIEK